MQEPRKVTPKEFPGFINKMLFTARIVVAFGTVGGAKAIDDAVWNYS